MPRRDAVQVQRVYADRSVTARVISDLFSDNYSSGVSGWRITKAGDAEFQDGTFRGNITASSGTIGGFTIGAWCWRRRLARVRGLVRRLAWCSGVGLPHRGPLRSG